MRVVLIIDAIINFALGVLLLLFSPALVRWLGVPPSSTSFYPNILGAIFIGITIALILGASSAQSRRDSGLGLMGAVSINLCGGATLGIWLIFGNLNMPLKGFVFLWILVAVLIGVSLAELVHFGNRRSSTSANARTSQLVKDSIEKSTPS